MVAGSRKAKARSRLGQVVVEMLLILPVFLTIVFTIMELGNIAFWVIVLNHGTFECARVGAMLYSDSSAKASQAMNDVMRKFLTNASVSYHTEETLEDPQAKQKNHDLIVDGTYSVHLVFPISSILLAQPKGSGLRQITAEVRMPIEQPLNQ